MKEEPDAADDGFQQDQLTRQRSIPPTASRKRSLQEPEDEHRKRSRQTKDDPRGQDRSHNDDLDSPRESNDDDEETQEGSINANRHHSTNDLFHEKYSKIVQALYHTEQQSKLQTPDEILDGIHDALNPPSTRDLPIPRDDGGFPEDKYDMVGRYEARKKAVYNRNPRTGRPSYRHVTHRLETPKEIEIRVRRMDRSEDRTKFNVRWGRRRVNVQKEADVGNAFASRAERHLRGTLQREKKRRRKDASNEERKRLKLEVEEETKKGQDKDANDTLEEDDSVNEQNQLLARFTRSSVSAQKKDASHGAALLVDSSVPFKDQFSDYWEFGYSMPRREDLQYNFDPSVEEMLQNSSTQIFSRIDEEDPERRNKSTVGFWSLFSLQKEGAGSFAYFPPNSTRVTNAHSTYRPGYSVGHIRQMIAMAARSLCGGPGDINLQDRYLRLLCSHCALPGQDSKPAEGFTVSNFGTRRFLHTLADERGRDMLLYAKSAWSNPVDAAMRLGVFSCQQDSPIAGNMLTRIPDQSTSNRTRVKRMYRKGSMLWTHSASTVDDGHDRDDTDFGEGYATPKLHGNLPDIPTSGGLRDLTLERSYSATDKMKKSNTSDEILDSLLTPNSSYAHVPLTKPPIPNFPLDPSSTVFGPVDRHSKFYHATVKMDIPTLQLTMSTLMVRLANARLSVQENPVQMETQKQIEAFLMECADINENKIFKRYGHLFPKSMTKVRDVPMVHVYHAVTAFCSYMANGGLGVLSSLNDIQHEGDQGGVIQREEKQDTETNCFSISGATEIAKKMWHFCGGRMNHDCLLRFPRLRITLAISQICRSLPRSAAEILSSPLDEHLCRTPMDLFKQTMRHMEENGMICDAQSIGDRNSVLAGELEYILHESAFSFLEAVRMEPFNVEYQLWLVGCLASCLLISSGNRIGSGARLYPSQKRRGFSLACGLPHEVRVRLKKYSAVRLELSSAVRTLFTLAEYQRSPKAHFAVSSFLEWRQVIALLMGRQSQDQLEKIGKLHKFHVRQWLLQEVSSFSFLYAERCQNQRDSFFYARQLENDPACIRNWRQMVACLGKLGSESTTCDSKEKDHRRQCAECGRLNSARWFEHDLISAQKAKETWWGNGREWWTKCLLHMVPMRTKRRDRKAIEGMIGHLNPPTPPEHTQHKQVSRFAGPGIGGTLNDTRRERGAPEDVKRRQEEETSPASTSSQHVAPVPAASSYSPSNCMQWLPTVESCESRESDQFNMSDDARLESYENDLPTTYQEVLNGSGTLQTELGNGDDGETIPYTEGYVPLKVSCPSLEVLAYRVFIFCHLCSIAHPSVEEHIHNLAVRCWDRIPKIAQSLEKCDELVVIRWFISMGMNVEAILQEMLPK